MESVQDLFKQVLKTYTDINEAENPGTYWKLSTDCSDLEASLREHIQTMAMDQMHQIIKKLDTSEAFTEEEFKCLKLWIVGDAACYAKMENNFPDWMTELDRLFSEIEKYNVENPDIETASRLRGIMVDTTRVLGDVVYYLQQKERIKNFDANMQEIDAGERAALKRILLVRDESSNA